MAMTGGTAKLVKTGTLNYGNANATVKLYVYYKTSQDTSSNKSTITCGMYIEVTSGWDIGSWGDFNGSYIGTTSNTFNGGIGSGTTGTKWLVENKTFTVEHDNDGTGTATIYWKWGVNAPWGQMVNPSGQFSITLPTIPRASTIDSLTCSTSYFDGTFTYKYTPKSASYYNKCNISLNGTSIKSISIGKKSVSQQTATATLSSSELSTIYGKLPSTATGTLRFTFRTYSDSGYSTQVGSETYKEIDLTIPTSVKPTVGTIALDPVNITTADGTSRNVLVKNKNKLSISVSGCSAGTGSSIKSYTFSGPGVSTTTTSTSATSSVISNTGTLTYTVTVTDNRGRTNSKKSTITCYEYSTPSFTSFKAYRVGSSTGTTANDSGTYVRCEYGITYSSVNNTNHVDVKIFYKKNTASSWSSVTAATDSTSKSGNKTLSSIDAAATYTIYAQVTDNYSGTLSSEKITVFGANRILNITSNGTGVAIGKMAESNNLFECRWPAKLDDACSINGGLTVGSSTQDSAPTNGITIHDVRNVDITPNSFGDKNVNFYFDNPSSWKSIIHMKGWAGDYAAWELAGNASTSTSAPYSNLYYRQGIGDKWGDWQTVLTNDNVASYSLPISGGTLTGQLKLRDKLYYASAGAAGLDCQNSDIINANAIYFQDATDSAGEGINFYNSSTTWDSIYTSGGLLKFHPNRGTSTAPDGYTIYNSSNFRRGFCTLSSSTATKITFSSAFTEIKNHTVTVFLTPYTSAAGVIPGKVTSVDTSGFSAIIGGNAVTSAQFAYLAVYY